MGDRMEARPTDARVLEEGHIYFLYRPTTDTHDPQGLLDVMRFHMVLRPHGRTLFRDCIIGRKYLPDLEEHERNWGYVARIAEDGAALEQDFREQTQETRTRGTRSYPAARPAGEGVYAFVQAGRNMHLAYVLHLPHEPGPVQRDLGIAPEGSWIMAIKNPDAGSPAVAGLPDDQRPDYPNDKRRAFRGRRWAPSDPTLLDFQGAEFVLIGAGSNVRHDLRVDLPTENIDPEHADIFARLRMATSRHPAKPLFEGEWE